MFKNIAYMCSRTSSKTWGKDSWKKIVVCMVSDGRAKINPRTRAVLAGMGVYQDGIAKQQVNGKDVTAHLYEYTTQVGICGQEGSCGTHAQPATTGADAFLLEGKEPEEDQFSQMVLPGFWTSSGPEYLRSY